MPATNRFLRRFSILLGATMQSSSLLRRRWRTAIALLAILLALTLSLSVTQTFSVGSLYATRSSFFSHSIGKPSLYACRHVLNWFGPREAPPTIPSTSASEVCGLSYAAMRWVWFLSNWWTDHAALHVNRSCSYGGKWRACGATWVSLIQAVKRSHSWAAFWAISCSLIKDIHIVWTKNILSVLCNHTDHRKTSEPPQSRFPGQSISKRRAKYR